MYTIISSIISAVAAIFVCILSQQNLARKQAMELEKQTALIDLKLSQLAEDVKKHNSIVERTYHLEKQYSVIDEKINNVNEKLESCVETIKEMKERE